MAEPPRTPVSQSANPPAQSPAHEPPAHESPARESQPTAASSAASEHPAQTAAQPSSQPEPRVAQQNDNHYQQPEHARSHADQQTQEHAAGAPRDHATEERTASASGQDTQQVPAAQPHPHARAQSPQQVATPAVHPEQEYVMPQHAHLQGPSHGPPQGVYPYAQQSSQLPHYPAVPAAAHAPPPHHLQPQHFPEQQAPVLPVPVQQIVPLPQHAQGHRQSFQQHQQMQLYLQHPMQFPPHMLPQQAQPTASRQVWGATVQCFACLRILTYAPGQALVACPACRTIINLRASQQLPPGHDGLSQCTGCSVYMCFPVGCTLVRCSTCDAVSATPPAGQYVCRCGLYVEYASSVPSTFCKICRVVNTPTVRETYSLQPLPPTGVSPTVAPRLHHMSLARRQHLAAHGTPSGASPAPQISEVDLPSPSSTAPQSPNLHLAQQGISLEFGQGTPSVPDNRAGGSGNVGDVQRHSLHAAADSSRAEGSRALLSPDPHGGSSNVGAYQAGGGAAARSSSERSPGPVARQQRFGSPGSSSVTPGGAQPPEAFSEQVPGIVRTGMHSQSLPHLGAQMQRPAVASHQTFVHPHGAYPHHPSGHPVAMQTQLHAPQEPYGGHHGFSVPHGFGAAPAVPGRGQQPLQPHTVQSYQFPSGNTEYTRPEAHMDAATASQQVGLDSSRLAQHGQGTGSRMPPHSSASQMRPTQSASALPSRSQVAVASHGSRFSGPAVLQESFGTMSIRSGSEAHVGHKMPSSNVGIHAGQGSSTPDVLAVPSPRTVDSGEAREIVQTRLSHPTTASQATPETYGGGARLPIESVAGAGVSRQASRQAVTSSLHSGARGDIVSHESQAERTPDSRATVSKIESQSEGERSHGALGDSPDGAGRKDMHTATVDESPKPAETRRLSFGSLQDPRDLPSGAAVPSEQDESSHVRPSDVSASAHVTHTRAVQDVKSARLAARSRGESQSGPSE